MALAEFPRHRFTVEEFHRMGDVGLLHPDDRVELIEGELADLSPIGRIHAAVVTRMGVVLSEALGRRAVVRVQQPLRLSRFSEPQPDLAVLLPRDDFYADVDPGPADAVAAVEVAHTTLRFDLDVKLPLYGRSGVVETWVVDLHGWGLVVATEPGPTGYATVRTLDAGDTVALLGAEVAVADLLGPRPSTLA